MSARDAALTPLPESTRAEATATCKRVGSVLFAKACGVAPFTLRIALEGKPVKADTHGAIASGLVMMSEPTRAKSYDHPSKPYGVAPGASTVGVQRERSYLEGRRRAYIDIATRALEALDHRAPLARVGELVVEIQEAKQRLRGLCERHGDNDWDEQLYLADIIEKHLGDYLDAPSSTDRGDEVDDDAPDVDAAVTKALGAPVAPVVPPLPTNNADVSSCDGCPFALPPLTLDDRYCSLDTAITWRPSQTEARIPPPACPLRREQVLVRLHPRVA